MDVNPSALKTWPVIKPEPVGKVVVEVVGFVVVVGAAVVVAGIVVAGGDVVVIVVVGGAAVVVAGYATALTGEIPA
jgi:hypothetical protein